MPDDTRVLDPAGEYTCKRCGQRFTRTRRVRGQRPHYCSPKCQVAAAHERGQARIQPVPCEWCGNMFQPIRESTRTSVCDRCSKLPRKCPLPPNHWARWYGKTSTWRPVCPTCGDKYVQDLQVTTTTVYCSRKCAKKAERDRRWARQRDAFVAEVPRAYIYRRDRYRCQLCGKPLAMSESVPHPNAPTLDHVIPLARGGTHEPSNVQAAHFLCNASKGDGYADAPEQMALIG